MTLAPWREGSFEIATQDGQFIVNGFVSEEFGIRDAGAPVSGMDGHAFGKRKACYARRRGLHPT